MIILHSVLGLQCASLSPVEHGGVHPRKGSYDEGDVVQFVCLDGYSLKGAELVQCYSFGWYPEPPICEGNTGGIFLPSPAALQPLHQACFFTLCTHLDTYTTHLVISFAHIAERSGKKKGGEKFRRKQFFFCFLYQVFEALSFSLKTADF